MTMFQALDEDGIPLTRPVTSRDVASLIAELEDAPVMVVSVETDKRRKGETAPWLRLVDPQPRV